MPPQKPRWMLWLQKSWQNKALWKNTQDPLPTARQGIFLLNHVEEFDILKSRSLWMERNIMFVKIKADIRHWLRELDKKYFCVMLGFAVMVYFPLISLKLTNTVDGLWTTAEYMAGAWELSNGRWFWLVTSFLRFSLQLEPINAVVCLVLVSLGVTKLHMTFKTVHEGRTSCLDWLAGLCYLANTVIGCYLSFAHQSVEFGLAFYLSVLAAVCVIRSRSIAAGIAQGAFLLALSLGLYQTDLACFCMVLLAWFLVLLFRGEEGIKLRYYIAKCLGSAVCGAALYWGILQIILKISGVAMTNYQGGASTSPLNMLKSLPQSIVKCYAQFWDYFFGDTVRHNVLQSFGVLYALAFLVVGAALVHRLAVVLRRKDAETAFYAVAAVLVMPLASVIFLLAASQATFYIPMAGGTALFFPVCFWLLDAVQPASNTETLGKNKAGKVKKAALLLAAAGILYGSVFMSAIDQQAMYEGRKATKQIADLVAGELVAEGYYDLPEKLPVMLVGRPSASPLFRTHIIYWDANDYAQVGLFEKENAATMRYSWNAVFRDLTPMQLELCSDEVYDELIRTEEIKRMPTFPEKGSMQEMDGVYVIKISEDYLIDE